MRAQVIEEQQEAVERGDSDSIGSSRIGDVLRAAVLVTDAKSALVTVSVIKQRMNVVRTPRDSDTRDVHVDFSRVALFHTVMAN